MVLVIQFPKYGVFEIVGFLFLLDLYFLNINIVVPCCMTFTFDIDLNMCTIMMS